MYNTCTCEKSKMYVKKVVQMFPIFFNIEILTFLITFLFRVIGVCLLREGVVVFHLFSHQKHVVSGVFVPHSLLCHKILMRLSELWYPRHGCKDMVPKTLVNRDLTIILRATQEHSTLNYFINRGEIWFSQCTEKLWSKVICLRFQTMLQKIKAL